LTRAQLLAEELRLYQQRQVPRSPDRQPVVARMLELLARPGDPFTRAAWAPGHFTASAFVLSPDGQRLLLIHHRRLGAWLQPGGHVETEDEHLEAAARREVAEETSIKALTPFSTGIFDVDAHLIPPSAKEPGHTHFDVRYAFVAEDERCVASSEVAGVRWVPLPEVVRLNPEESISRPVQLLSASD
jgi:8-oxo-dGTP pyrophosphatase MutT (NUDIX family)